MIFIFMICLHYWRLKEKKIIIWELLLFLVRLKLRSVLCSFFSWINFWWYEQCNLQSELVSDGLRETAKRVCPSSDSASCYSIREWFRENHILSGWSKHSILDTETLQGRFASLFRKKYVILLHSDISMLCFT